ncbi:hypothetical protein ACTJKO_12865 [Curtobacterium sp. 22159]|uniref:hypothetical protein n=1 Tax=Curtobacterium sp. 22159 TaxID=3453882 RepID=UPI003F8498C7
MRRLRLDPVIVGVIAAALFAFLASLALGGAKAPLGGDEAAHFDYVIDVWHGHLPVFEDGLTIRPPFGSLPPVQWVAQHPPGFYVLLAPVVGPLWDAGHLLAAVFAARLLNAVFAGLAVVAVAWAARRIVPARPAVAVTSAAVMALTPMLVLVGSAVYNDLVNVVFSALALGIAATAILRGLSTRLVIGAVLVLSGGMLSRLTFVVFVAAVVVAFLCARGFAGGLGGGFAGGRGWNGWPGRVGAVLLAVAAPAAASGWFYLRNRELSGNFAGSHPEWSAKVLHRAPAGFTDTVLSRDFYQGLFGVFRGDEAYLGWTWLLLFVPLALGLVALLIAAVRGARHRPRAGARAEDRAGAGAGARARRGPDARVDTDVTVVQRTLVVLMLLAVFVLLVVVQVFFVMQGGRPQTRYGLPIMTVLAVVMALGLVSWGRVVSLVLTTLWAAGAVTVWLRLLDLSGPSQLTPWSLTVARVSAVLAVVVLVAAVAGAWVVVLRRRRLRGRRRLRSV